MPEYGNLQIPYPNTSAVPDVPGDLLTLIQRLELMLGGGITLTANATTRAALVTNGDAFNGLTVMQLDTYTLYVYRASAWKAIVNPLALPGTASVVPTSVAGTGVTVGTYGQVSLSASPSASLNGIFSSSFDNYLLVPNIQLSANSEVTVRLRLAGSDAATNYNDVRVFTTTTAGISQVLAGTAWRLSIAPGAVSGWLQGAGVTLLAPALAAATGYDSQMNAAVGNTAFAQSRVSGHHSASTAYDGISFIATSGTMTGTIRCYGYNNN